MSEKENKKYHVFFDMSGDLTIEAKSRREAREKVYKKHYKELIPFLNGDVNIEIDQVEEIDE